MSDISEAERLRHITNCRTHLVLNAVRLAEEAIGRVVEDQDNPKAFHVSRGLDRPACAGAMPI